MLKSKHKTKTEILIVDSLSRKEIVQVFNYNVNTVIMDFIEIILDLEEKNRVRFPGNKFRLNQAQNTINESLSHIKICRDI
jgi:hypothetical protein